MSLVPPLRLMMVQAAIMCNLCSRLPAIVIYGMLQELTDIKYSMCVTFILPSQYSAFLETGIYHTVVGK